MVRENLLSIFIGFFKLGLLAGAVFYAGLVVMSYGTRGPRTRPQIDPDDPLHSAERWAVWLGVLALALAVRIATPVVRMLSEASADVGEWVLNHRHHEAN